MTIQPPFAALEKISGSKWLVLAGLMAGTLLLSNRLGKMGRVLKTAGPPAPWGIISYELAGSEAQAGAILATWASVPAGTASARRSLYLDYLFLCFYSTLFSQGCYLAASAFKEAKGWYTAGLWLMYGQWLAATLDAVENAALLAMLNRQQAVVSLPQLALLAASAKFLLIFLGLGYALVGLVKGITSRLFAQSNSTDRTITGFNRKSKIQNRKWSNECLKTT
jgi:hypothetical protein